MNFANIILFHFSYREIKKARPFQNLTYFHKPRRYHSPGPGRIVMKDTQQVSFPFTTLPFPGTHTGTNTGPSQPQKRKFKIWYFKDIERWSYNGGISALEAMVILGQHCLLCAQSPARHTDHLVIILLQSYKVGLAAYNPLLHHRVTGKYFTIPVLMLSLSPCVQPKSDQAHWSSESPPPVTLQ